jgi:tetratricopeptide (TPR) repeat protein
MSDFTQSLQESLIQQLSQTNYDVAGIVPIPVHTDTMIRLRTLQEIFEEMNETHQPGVLEYLIQIKPKVKPTEATPSFELPIAQESPENVYLPNGKLNVPFLLQNADILAEAGEYSLARKIHKTLLAAGEQTSTTQFRMGKCFEAEGKLDEAKACYEESIAYHPSLETYQKLLALLIRQGKDQEAAEVIERTLNLKDLPRSLRFEFHKTAGNCWLRANKPIHSERHFKCALELDPTADEIRSNLGVLCLQDNRTFEAKRHFQDAIASNPKNANALAGLGSAFLQEGDKSAAHDYYAESLSLELNNPSALFNLVRCAYDLKRYATAAELLEGFIQVSPISPSLLYSLAGLQYHLGRMPEAKKTSLKILELHRDHTGATELLRMLDRFVGV